MRSSRIATLSALAIGVAGVVGCGDDSGGPTDDDRSEVLRVARAAAAAEAAGDARARCALMTTRMQRDYISGFAGDGRGRRDVVACAAAVNRGERSFPAGDLARFRRVARRVEAAARDEGNIAIDFEDGHADVVVDASRNEQDDGYFRLERDDGRWRVGMYPETATLR